MRHTSRATPEYPPTSGKPLPASLQRKLPKLESPSSRTLVKHIVRLKALHPEVRLNFRQVQLEQMDEATLKVLLSDLNGQLGVD